VYVVFYRYGVKGKHIRTEELCSLSRKHYYHPVYAAACTGTNTADLHFINVIIFNFFKDEADVKNT